ncbi:hypothetical protein [Desulfuromonas sp. TF]|uniref:hypothetical protein n=1 Tax=Desulfuromonas sp. TF TaxID=1232410 RepID=UPI000415FBF7|nr:hypothetical protein [Desulfuromonas sp. TF]
MSSKSVIIEVNDSQGKKYRNYRPLNVHRYSENRRVAVAIRDLCGLMDYRGYLAEKQAKVLILDLYHCYKGDKKRYIQFYRNPNFYESIQRYNWFGISFKVVKNITDRLSELGYVEMKKGFRDEKTDFRVGSKMKAEKALIAFLEDHGIEPKMITTWSDEEVIILKEKTRKERIGKKVVKLKPKKDYLDNKLTIKMRKVVTDYNNLIGNTYIDIDTHGYRYVRKFKAGHTPSEKQLDPLRIDLSRKRSYRVFTENFESGGRWYGPWWQSCPEELRRRIIIEGEHVVEFDFSGLHIHLLYALKGLKLGDKEPYIIPKHNDPAKLRRIYKLLMLTSVNCKSDQECLAAVEDQLTDEMLEDPDNYPEQIPNLEQMLKELKEHHDPISDFINKSTGLKLQALDSSIAEEVIKNMTAQKIPILCVHDSFICKDSDSEVVHIAMKQAFVDKVSEYVKAKGVELSLILEEIETTEAQGKGGIISYYGKKGNGILRFASSIITLGSTYRKRYLLYLAKKDCNINHVVKINPIIEYI